MGSCYHVFFRTLGSELKTDIITALKEKSSGVNVIARTVNQERSKVSHALKPLLDCGFVFVEKYGRNRIYSLNKDTILPLLNLIEKHTKKYCKMCKHQEVGA